MVIPPATLPHIRSCQTPRYISFWRKLFSESAHFRLTFSATVKALLPGRRKTQKILLHLCLKAQSCSFRSQFRPTDIFQLDERTIRRGLITIPQTPETFVSLPTAWRSLIHLPIYRWLLTDSPSTYLKVLFLNRVKYGVSSRKVATISLLGSARRMA